MRILYVHNAFARPLGGAEMYFLRLAQDVHRQGHEAQLATMSTPSDFDPDGVPVVELKPWMPYRPALGVRPPLPLRVAWHAIDIFNPTVLPSLQRAIREFRPDVVHTCNFQGLSGASFVAGRSIPRVHTVLDYSLVNPRCLLPKSNDSSRTAIRLRTAVLRRLFRPSLVLFPSEQSRAVHASAGMPAGDVRSEVMELGWPSPLAGTHAAVTRGSPVRFLFLGRVIEDKGVPLLLDAWRRAAPDGAELFIAGVGPLAGEVTTAATADASIRYFGWADPELKSELFRKCDVLLHPSKSEVFSISCSEACVSGLAIVVTPDAAPPFVKNGYNGRVLEPDGVAWGAEIARLAADHAYLAELQTGAETTAQKLDWSSHVRDIERIYESIVA